MSARKWQSGDLKTSFSDINLSPRLMRKIWRHALTLTQKEQVHHDLLPTSHPDWGGTEAKFSSKEGTERAPAKRQQVCWAWVLGVTPARRGGAGGLASEQKPGGPHAGGSQPPSSHPVHDSRGTSQDLWANLQHILRLNKKVLNQMVKKQCFLCSFDHFLILT